MWVRLAALCGRVYFFVAMSVFAGAFTAIPERLSGTHMETGEQNIYNTIGQTFVLVGVCLIYARRWRDILPVVRLTPAVNAFVLLAFASVLWSVAPDVTARRDLSLASAVGLAYYALACIPVEVVVRRVAIAIVIPIIASVGVALALPDLGVMSDAELDGAWNGVFAHKSQLGWMTILGSLLFGWLFINEPRRRFRYAFALGLCLVCAIMSRSRTAQLAIVAFPLAAFTSRAFRLGGIARLWVLFGLLVLTVGAVAGVAAFYADLMEFLGKDPSLTGRVPLWSALLQLASDHFVLGYGYGSFFVGSNLDMQWVRRAIGWSTPEAHEAYIEIFIQLGVPGLLIALFVIFDAVRLSLIEVGRKEVPWASLAASFTIVFAMTNNIETMLFHSGDVFCFFLPFVYAALRERARARRQYVDPAQGIPGQATVPS